MKRDIHAQNLLKQPTWSALPADIDGLNVSLKSSALSATKILFAAQAGLLV